MKSQCKKYRNNLNVNVVLILVVPILFILMASFGYASINSTIYTIATLQSPEYDIKITDCQVEFYNGLCYEIFYNENSVSFNDSNVFPGWELILNLTILNTLDSWVCKLQYTIFYWNETANDWIATDETELLNLFKLQYETAFYNATGDIITENPELNIGEIVYKMEHLKFVATPEEYENLLLKEVILKIEVLATYPDPPFDGGE